MIRQMQERPPLDLEPFVERVAAAIEIDPEDLKGRGKAYELSRARELLATLGVERYGFRVKDLVEYLNKHPVTVPGWAMHGIRQRAEDPATLARIEALDHHLCGRPTGKDLIHVPGTISVPGTIFGLALP